VNINFSCRYKRKDISSAPPSGILRILRFFPPCSVHHETSQLYACSFSSPDGQRCRDGCYGDTLVFFIGHKATACPIFASYIWSSWPDAFLFRFLDSLFFYRCFHKHSGTFARRWNVVRQQACFLSSTKTLLLSLSLWINSRNFLETQIATDFSSNVVAVFQISCFNSLINQ